MTDCFSAVYNLEDADRAKGVEITKAFGDNVLLLEERCRARAPTAEQVATIKTLSELITSYLAIAATKYAVPEAPSRGGATL